MDGIDPKTLNSLRKAGATQEQIDAELQRVLPEISLTEEEGKAVLLFSKVQTQWNRQPMSGQLLSLNYSAVEVVARSLKIELDSDMWRSIQLMEIEVIREVNQRGG